MLKAKQAQISILMTIKHCGFSDYGLYFNSTKEKKNLQHTKNEGCAVKFVTSFIWLFQSFSLSPSENACISAFKGPRDKVKSSQVNPKVNLVQ